MRCPHPNEEVVANITSQDAVWRHDHSDYIIQWCRWCGAYRTLTGTASKRWTPWEVPTPPRCRESKWAAILDGAISALVVTPLVLVAFAFLWVSAVKFTIWLMR